MRKKSNSRLYIGLLCTASAAVFAWHYFSSEKVAVSEVVTPVVAEKSIESKLETPAKVTEKKALAYTPDKAYGDSKPRDAISRFGEPDYTYAKSSKVDVPKGGTLRLGAMGTFDGINNHAIKGVPVAYMNLCYESLMLRSPTEPFALYAAVAEKVLIAPDNSRVTFYLNPKARFHNGDAVTTADVKATMETLQVKGLPRFRNYYGKIQETIIHDDHTIEFVLKPIEQKEPSQANIVIYDADLPMILALATPVYNKKQLEEIDFANSGLTPLIGTGPYSVEDVQQGRSIKFKRNADYWAKDLPNAKGRYNFDHISIEYFKNATAFFQGFLAKVYDIFFETNPQQWRMGYTGKAVQNGEIVLEKATHNRPVTVRTIIMNMRRPVFQDIELRRAILMAFDADTLNKMLFDGEMNVPHSLFANTELAHHGAATGDELALLNRFKDKIDPTLFKRLTENEFSPAHTDGHGNQRENLLKAAKILDDAGYKVQKGKRLAPDGKPLELSLMLKDEKLEKIALSLKESLKKLGITLVIRKFDANQYENRVLESDFDMIVHAWGNTLSPGTEQGYYFGTKTADIKGSSNYIGLKDLVAEALASEVAKAKTWEELKTSVHALDRYVMHLCLQIPLSFDNQLRFAYWKDRVKFPTLEANKDMDVMTRGWSPEAAQGTEEKPAQ